MCTVIFAVLYKIFSVCIEFFYIMLRFAYAMKFSFYITYMRVLNFNFSRWDSPNEGRIVFGVEYSNLQIRLLQLFHKINDLDMSTFKLSFVIILYNVVNFE